MSVYMTLSGSYDSLYASGLDPYIITICKLKTHICTSVVHMQRRPVTAVIREGCAQLHTPDIVVGSHRHAQSNFCKPTGPTPCAMQ